MTRKKHREPGLRISVLAFLAAFITLAAMAYPIETDRESAAAPEGSRLALGILGGYGIFSNSNFSNSVAVGVTFTYSFNKNLAVELAGLFLNESNESDPATLAQGKLTTMPLQLSLLGRYPLGKKFALTALAGITYFLNSFSLDSALVDNWHDLGFTMTESVNGALGFHCGAGLEYVLKKNLSAALGVRYCLGTAKGEWSIRDDASALETSGTFNGLDLNTMVFSFGLKYFFK